MPFIQKRLNKKYIKMKRILFYCLAATLFFASCGGDKPKEPGTGNEPKTEASQKGDEPAEQPDGTYRADEAMKFYEGNFDKNTAFTVISKKTLRLSVYARNDKGDTVLVVRYPVCLSRIKGNKEMKGDNKTPESPKGQPFRICQIQDASTWCHDFGDGRGEILAYGKWFHRLETPGHSGIGIHGSTNNETSVPGRASEGCIRMRDAELIHFHDNYAYVDMPVIIKAEGEGLQAFEVELQKGEGKPLGLSGE